jgi:hypothetical protein
MSTPPVAGAPPPPPPPPPPTAAQLPPLPPAARQQPQQQSLAVQLAQHAAAESAGASSATARAAAIEALECAHEQPRDAALCGGTEDFLRQMEATQFERYWRAIEPFTFRSVMLPLTADELTALANGHAELRACRVPSLEAVEAQLQQPHVGSVVRKVGTGAQQLGVQPGETFFVRLSSRSPKDAILSAPSLDFRAALAKIQAEVASDEDRLYSEHPSLPPSSTLNQQLHAQYIASTRLLATTAAERAVENLLVSERIQEDLHVAAAKLRALEASADTDTPGVEFSCLSEPEPEPEPQPEIPLSEHGEGAFVFNLVVREFGQFAVRNEVRGFVFDRRFTALTQYHIHAPFYLCLFLLLLLFPGLWAVNHMWREGVRWREVAEPSVMVVGPHFVSCGRYNDMIYFPHALVEREAMIAKTAAFMRELIPRVVGLDAFVVDLVLLNDNRVMVIGASPARSTASSYQLAVAGAGAAGWAGLAIAYMCGWYNVAAYAVARAESFRRIRWLWALLVGKAC